MSQNKKKAIERLRENSPGLDMWEHINLHREAIVELAKRMDEMGRIGGNLCLDLSVVNCRIDLPIDMQIFC